MPTVEDRGCRSLTFFHDILYASFFWKPDSGFLRSFSHYDSVLFSFSFSLLIPILQREGAEETNCGGS